MSTNLIRYLANFALLIGQAFILYGDITVGIIIKLGAGIIILSYMIKYKLWDMVIVLIAFLILDLSKLIQLQI